MALTLSACCQADLGHNRAVAAITGRVSGVHTCLGVRLIVRSGRFHIIRRVSSNLGSCVVPGLVLRPLTRGTVSRKVSISSGRSPAL